jgi:hypothetical protein
MTDRRTESILALLTAEPQTATQIFRAWRGLPPFHPLRSRDKRDRRWLAERLESLSSQGVVCRDSVINRGRAFVTFTSATKAPPSSGPDDGG